MLQDEPHFTTTSYFDRDFDTEAVKILPGEYFATSDATAISTLLGSCVSVCLYDPTTGVGGMNHFMLPEMLPKAGKTPCSSSQAASCTTHCSGRYGACAMRQLIERLERLGARLPRLEAKVFGAGRVMAGGADIGAKNASFALGYLEERGIPVMASDLGERFPRKVFFFPATGRVFVKRLITQLPEIS